MAAVEEEPADVPVEEFLELDNGDAEPGGLRTNQAGIVFHDVMERFEVSFDAEPEFEKLVAFLETMCQTLDEETIYLTRGDESFLVNRK